MGRARTTWLILFALLPRAISAQQSMPWPQGQSMSLDSAQNLGFYCFIKGLLSKLRPYSIRCMQMYADLSDMGNYTAGPAE